MKIKKSSKPRLYQVLQDKYGCSVCSRLKAERAESEMLLGFVTVKLKESCFFTLVLFDQ